MGIGFTNTRDFDVISIYDSALKDVDASRMRHYELTRDIEELPASIWQSDDPPTVFRVRPLQISWESAALSFDTSAVRLVIREHVIDIRRGRAAKHPDYSWEKGKLDEESNNKIPITIASEIAGVIMQAQERVPGGPIPFTPTSQPGYLQAKDHLKLKMRLAAVIRAAEETAKNGTD